MVTVTIEEAQATLPELIDRLTPGGEVVITSRDQPVARLVAQRAQPSAPRQPGSARGLLTIASEDEEHLNDFENYMP